MSQVFATININECIFKANKANGKADLKNKWVGGGAFSMTESSPSLRVFASRFEANQAVAGAGCVIFMRNNGNVQGSSGFQNNLFTDNEGCNAGLLVDLMSRNFTMIDQTTGKRKFGAAVPMVPEVSNVPDPEWVANLKSFNLAVKNCLEEGKKEELTEDDEFKEKCGE